MRVEVTWWAGLGGMVGGCGCDGTVVDSSLDGDRERSKRL